MSHEACQLTTLGHCSGICGGIAVGIHMLKLASNGAMHLHRRCSAISVAYCRHSQRIPSASASNLAKTFRKLFENFSPPPRFAYFRAIARPLSSEARQTKPIFLYPYGQTCKEGSAFGGFGVLSASRRVPPSAVSLRSKRRFRLRRPRFARLIRFCRRERGSLKAIPSVTALVPVLPPYSMSPP